MVSKVKLVATFIGYLNTRNAAGLRSIFSSDFVQLTRPATLGAHPIGRDEYIQQFLSAPVKYINMSLPTAANTAEEGDTIQYYTSTNGRTNHGFPWKMETMHKLIIKNDKITLYHEFLDSVGVQVALLNETIGAAATCS